MTTAQRSLRKLITEDMYVLDEHAVAAAILARAAAHATVARAQFHNDPPTAARRDRRTLKRRGSHGRRRSQ
jgi:hypothetical protein